MITRTPSLRGLDEPVDPVLETVRRHAANLRIEHLAVLEDDEGGHGLDLVVLRETGLLVDYDPARAGDAEFVASFESDFAEKVNRLTRDQQQASDMGLAGRRRCIDEFSWEKIAQETVAVYEKAIAYHQSH